jgi:hypothetical protein
MSSKGKDASGCCDETKNMDDSACCGQLVIGQGVSNASLYC